MLVECLYNPVIMFTIRGGVSNHMGAGFEEPSHRISLLQSLALTRSLIDLTTPPCLSRAAHHVDERFAGLNDGRPDALTSRCSSRSLRVYDIPAAFRPETCAALSDNGLEV